MSCIQPGRGPRNTSLATTIVKKESEASAKRNVSSPSATSSGLSGFDFSVANPTLLSWSRSISIVALPPATINFSTVSAWMAALFCFAPAVESPELLRTGAVPPARSKVTEKSTTANFLGATEENLGPEVQKNRGDFQQVS